MFNIDIQSRLPIYEQLKNNIMELIIKGMLHENDQLPSVRNLAKELNINPNTIAKTYRMLEHDGIIYSATGRGSFIASVDYEKVKDYVLVNFDASVEEALKAGISKDELIKRIKSNEVKI